MTKFKLFGAAVILSVLLALPASAQQAVQEPGMAAFYNPNADLGIGSTRSPVNAQAMGPARMIMHHPLNTRRVRSDR
jgi:hypothetical protein